jgi:hypothetical protein
MRPLLIEDEPRIFGASSKRARDETPVVDASDWMHASASAMRDRIDEP